MYQRARAPARGRDPAVHGPCTHKGCGAPFAPLTDPPGQRGPRGAWCSSSSPSTCAGRRRPTGPRCEYYVQGARTRSSAPTGGRRGHARRGARAGRARSATRRPPGRRRGRTSPTRRPGFSLAFNKYGTVAATPFVPTDQRLEGPRASPSAPRRSTRRSTWSARPACTWWPSSTATDTDWHAKLSDVAPDGSESLITEGALRASHRALDPRQEHTGPAVPPAHRPAADRARPLLRLRHRDLADGLSARARAPAAAAPDVDRPADSPARLDRLRSQPARRRRASTSTPPATNTVRFDGSYLVLPAAGPLARALGDGSGVRASRAARRSARATSAVSASATRDAGCCACRCGLRGAPAARFATA